MNKNFAKSFIEEANRLIDAGKFLEAGELLTNTTSGHGPAWTHEVETLHREPADYEENELAIELNIILLKTANALRGGITSGDMKSLWLTVLCLNKLGKAAPKGMINKLLDDVDRYSKVYAFKYGEMYRLVSFLPVVSYYH